MKLAEALQERADINKKISELKRLWDNLLQETNWKTELVEK